MAKRKLILSTLIIAFGLISFYFISKKRQENNNILLENGVMTFCTITDKSYYSDNTGRNFLIKYSYSIKNQRKVGSYIFKNRSTYDIINIGDTFPVYYNHETSEQLVPESLIVLEQNN